MLHEEISPTNTIVGEVLTLNFQCICKGRKNVICLCEALCVWCLCVCVCHLLQTEDECLSTENLVRLSGLA